MEFILYHDNNKRLAQYIKKYTELDKYESKGLASISIIQLPKSNNSSMFAELPEALRKLLFFAKPDLVICLDNGISPIKPIFAIEITEHVPAQDHWMQRFNNLVGCAQEGVPGAYILPFDMGERAHFSGELGSVFFFAYDRVMEIHQTPFYVADWEGDKKGTKNGDSVFPNLPDHKSNSMINTIKFIDMVVNSAVSGRPFSLLMRERLIVELRNEMRKIAFSRIPQISDFKRLEFNMPEGKYLNDTELENWLMVKGISMPLNIPDRIKKRDKSVIFVPQPRRLKKGTPIPLSELRTKLKYRISEKGADPYLGQPLAFDYMFCRLGPTPYERDANLIIDLSVLKFADIAGYHKSIWDECPLQYDDLSKITNIPQYTMNLTSGCAQVMKNFLRVYAFTADIIVFEDGMVYF